MAELHYANLGKKKPIRTMKNAYYRLTPIFAYLDRAIKVIESLQPELKWEEVTGFDPEGDEVTENSDELGDEKSTQDVRIEESDVAKGEEPMQEGLSDTVAGYPIAIYSVSDKESSKVFDQFLNSRYILDAPGRQTRKNTIRVLEANHDENVLYVDRLPKGEFVYCLPDNYALKRQKGALQYLSNTPRREYLPLINLIETSTTVRWPSIQKATDIEWAILTDEARPGLERQREFVQIALATPDFAILEGPPGSGKTTVITELILQAIKQGKRVLLCASTHIAVDNVLERLADRNDVIAVRIGDEGNVKDTLRHLTFNRRKWAEKVAITKFLKGLGRRRNEAQDFLLRALSSEEGEHVITKLILESANLVCGTTIGFLQHPDIKAARVSSPVFDFMILDEASKTTFQEFLVPALYARRWIICGDVRQLSPYVDEKEVEGNIEGLLADDATAGDICLNVFDARRYIKQASRRKGLLVVEDQESPLFNKYILQAKARGLETFVLTKENYDDVIKSPLLLGSEAFVVDQSIIHKVEEFLPPDLQVLFGVADLPLDTFRRRTRHWQHYHNVERRSRREVITWQGEFTWRMTRDYELRNTPKEREYLQEQMDLILPAWLSPEATDHLQRHLHGIKRIALPSCLELLQEGFEKSPQEIAWEKKSGWIHDYVLACGFPEKELRERHVMLEYQHRMHPHISAFPRENIYVNPESKEPEGLLDPDDMADRRMWNYDHYQTRRCWVDVKGRKEQGRNVNVHEIARLIEELRSFQSWTRKNRKPSGGLWTVAILTFYRGQERELSLHLRRFFRRTNFRYFTDKGNNLKVEVCTVDRFQGHEADVVFLSFVKDGFGVGFLNSPHRLNVALTRARYQLVIFGNQRSFIRAYEKGRLNSDLLYQLAKQTPSELSWREYGHGI